MASRSYPSRTLRISHNTTPPDDGGGFQTQRDYVTPQPGNSDLTSRVDTNDSMPTVPPEDGGYKYNPPNGGPADIDITSSIEREANVLLESNLSGLRRIP